MWDAEEAGPQPPSSAKGWAELNENERTAAQRLGYKHNTWDVDNCVKRLSPQRVASQPQGADGCL